MRRGDTVVFGRARLAKRWLAVGGFILTAALLAPAGSPPPGPEDSQASTLPSGFDETTVFTGLTNPTVVRFAPDGRIFVAEKSGVIKEFDSVPDTTPTTVADLNSNVYNFWDRGLLGTGARPELPDEPYVYVLYTYDTSLGQPPAPEVGHAGHVLRPVPDAARSDDRRLRRQRAALPLQASGEPSGSEQVLVEDWCQQFPASLDRDRRVRS